MSGEGQHPRENTRQKKPLDALHRFVFLFKSICRPCSSSDHGKNERRHRGMPPLMKIQNKGLAP